jgi:hypothetical protein
MFVVIGLRRGGFQSRVYRVRIFRSGKEDWTVVTEFALVAPDKLE